MTSTRESSAYAAGYLGIVPATQKYLARNYDMPAYQGDTIGALIGSSFCAFISHPLDTVKTCMQGDVEQKRTRDSLKHLGICITKRVDFVPCIVDTCGDTVTFSWISCCSTLMRATAPIFFPFGSILTFTTVFFSFWKGRKHTRSHNIQTRSHTSTYIYI